MFHSCSAISKQTLIKMVGELCYLPRWNMPRTWACVSTICLLAMSSAHAYETQVAFNPDTGVLRIKGSNASDVIRVWEFTLVNKTSATLLPDKYSYVKLAIVSVMSNNVLEHEFDIWSPLNKIQIEAGGGDDTIEVTSGEHRFASVEIAGGPGRDTITVGGANEYRRGGGWVKVQGNEDNDTIVINRAAETLLLGGPGVDTIMGGSLVDEIYGNDDGDFLY